MALAHVLYSTYSDNMHKRWWIPCTVIAILLLPILLPLWSKTILGSADNLAHLFRVVNLAHALSQGYVWPRWAALEAHRYGAPIFNFNYMLPYYFVWLLWQMTGSLIHASQLFMMGTLLGSAFGMYLFVSSLFTIPAAIVAALVYAYMPYHLMTVYLYGGYGEALAFVWSPFFTYFFVRFIQYPKKYVYGVSSIIVFALLILTHNLSALMAVPFVYSVMFFVTSGLSYSKRAIYAALVTTSSALLTAWFWLPSLSEQQYTKLSVLFEKETSLRGYFFQMISPIIENSIAALRFTAPSYYSYAIGIPTIVIVLVAGTFLLQKLISRKNILAEHYRIAFVFMLWFVLTLYMTRAVSEPLWKLLPAALNFLSYPYRFFFLNTFAVAVLAGFVVFMSKSIHSKRISNIISIGLGVFVMWQGVIYAHPAIDRFSFGEEYFSYEQTVREAPFTHKNMGYIEFIPRTADSDFVNGLDALPQKSPRVEVVDGNGNVFIDTQKAQYVRVHVRASERITLRVNILYFPGWVGIRNGVILVPTIDKQGRMEFTLPAGEYNFEIQFRNTLIRKWATAISIVSVCLSVLIIAFYFYKNIFQKTEKRGGLH